MLRITLFLIFLCSLSFSIWNIVELKRNPLVSALQARAGEDLSARLNAELAKGATPQNIEAQLRRLLGTEPTPWLAIEAVRKIAITQNVSVSPDLVAEIDRRHDAEHGFIQNSGKCISCGWNAANCELSAILLCRAPVDLTPVGDIAGVIRESGNYVLGNEVDRIDLTLSAVGLGATVVAPATGGSSLAVKAGASAIKTTRKLGNLSPGLSRILARSADEAIDWQKISKASPLDFPETLKAATNLDALRPVTSTLEAAGDIRASTSSLDALHLIKFVDNADEAASTARAARVLGPKTVGAFEIVGKSRLLRATLKYSDEAWAVISGILSALASLALLLANLFGNALLRRLRRRL